MRAPQGSRRREKSYEMKFGKFFGGALLRITLPCVKDVQPRAHLQGAYSCESTCGKTR
jgi:hypothetical protein